MALSARAAVNTPKPDSPGGMEDDIGTPLVHVGGDLTGEVDLCKSAHVQRQVGGEDLDRWIDGQGPGFEAGSEALDGRRTGSRR